MPDWFKDATSEISEVIAYLERKRDIDNTVSTVTPEHALSMAEYAAYYPTATPGLVRSLAQSGTNPDDPVAQFTITQDMLRKHTELGNYAGQLGAPRRSTRPPTPWQSITNTYANNEIRDLMTQAEEVGIYLPDKEIIIKTSGTETDVPTGETSHGEIFNSLVQAIYNRTREPVPFLDATSGAITAYSPEYAGPVGSYSEYQPYDLRSAKPLDSLGQQNADYWATNLAAVQAALDSTGFRSMGTEDALRNAAEKISAEYNLSIESQAQESPMTAQSLQESGLYKPTDVGSPAALFRPVAMAFDAPLQELQGVVRKAAGSLSGHDVSWLQSQSDLGVVIPRLVRGQEIETGAGFFVDPDSAVATERRAREAEAGQIGDHNITIGRLLASTITEPDTKPFQVISGLTDAAVQIADPTAFALGKAKNLSIAMRTFQPDEAAGTFRTFRNYFHGPTADAWLNRNTKLVDRFTATRDPYDIAQLTNFKLAPDMTRALARARTPNEVRNIITDAVSHGRVRQTTELSQQRLLGINKQSIRETWRELSPTHNPRSIRLFQQMPSEYMDLENPAQVARNTVRLLHNANAPESEIRAAYNLIANARTKNALFSAIEDTQKRVGGLLDQYGISDPEVRSFLTRINQETYVQHARGLVDQIGMDAPIWEHMDVNGQITKIPGPHLPLEHIGRYVHIPNIREVRRLTSRYPFLTTTSSRDFVPVLKQVRRTLGKEEVIPTGQLRLPLAFLDNAMSRVLKPLWLARLAWPIRVVGEEQLRMASAGLDSAFSGHPISYLALVIGGKENRLNTLLDAMTPGLKPSHALTPTGGLMEELDALKEVTYRSHSSWLDSPQTVATANRTVYTKANPHEASDFRRAWADELSKLNHDPLSNRVLNATDIEDVVDWLMTGPGRKFRTQLMDSHPGNLVTRDQVRTYLDTITDRIGHAVSGDTDLLDILRTGRFTDSTGKVHQILSAGPEPRIAPEFHKYLRGKFDNSAPERIVGQQYSRKGLQSNFALSYNAAVDSLMYVLGGAPTSALSRSPAFRQFLWRRTAELLPYSDVASRASILRNAEAANLPNRTMRYLRRQADRNLGTSNLTDIEVEDLAKGYAIDDTKNLLYDLSEKSQAADILRNIIPFGEAWREVITRWASLATIRGPLGVPLPGKPVRRLQQIVTGARGEDFGDFMGAPEGKGFFYQNTFGEEVFVYPGSEWFTNAATGIPVPLTGRTQGLNMWGSIMPSIGPAAQIPVAWFLQDKPQLDWWREQLLPFGGPGAEDAEDVFGLKAYMPGWAKSTYEAAINFLQGHSDDRIYANNIMDVASYLYSTGKYKDTPEDQQRLLNDAKRDAGELYLIRSLGQFMLPASPSFNWLIQDKDGRNVSLRVLAEEFYLEQEDDYDNAVGNFIDKYGTYAIGAIVPHSRSAVYGLPTSLEGAKWVAKNPDIKQRFPLTYGFFAPTGDFHMPTFLEQFTDKSRETLTVEQWRMVRDNLLGNYHYNRALDMLGTRRNNPAENQQEWLSQQRENIEELYPMFGRREGLSQRPETEDMIKELYDIKDNPTIARTGVGKALIAYLDLRDKAQAQAESLDYQSFVRPLALAPTRQWLADSAQELISKYPQFKQLWDIILSREVGEVVEREAGYGS